MKDPLKDFVSAQEEDRFKKDKKLEMILGDLNRVSYDAEKAINQAFDSLNYI